MARRKARVTPINTAMGQPRPRLVVPPRHAGSVAEQAAELWRERKRNKPRLLRAICPKCSYEFMAPEQYGVSVCRCGWLLRLEPIRAGRVGGRYEPILAADAVLEVVPDGHRLEEPSCQERFRAGIQKVIENWRARGLAHLEIDQATGRFGIRMPTHEAEYDPEAERKFREEHPAESKPQGPRPMGPMANRGKGHVDVRVLERRIRKQKEDPKGTGSA